MSGSLLDPGNESGGDPEGAQGGATRSGGQGQDQGQGGQGDNEGGTGAGERPDFIPVEAWGEHGYDPEAHLGQLRIGRRPETAEAYTLPTIDGLDAERAAASPIIAVFRSAAFEAGLSQSEFEAQIGAYVEAETTKAAETRTAELGKLGDNAEGRIKALNVWLGGALPADQAKAIAAGMTSASAVIALEALMRKVNGGRSAPADAGGGATTRKTRAEIETLMNSKAYIGRPHERDPAVIAEVDQWFRDEAANKRKPK